MNDIPNCFYRTSIKALISNEDGKFLLARNLKGQWEIPGGGLDFGENARDCLKRELIEELGIHVVNVEEKPDLFITVKDSNGVWKAMVIFKTKLENLNHIKSDECQELKYFNKEEALRENCHPMTVAVLEQI